MKESGPHRVCQVCSGDLWAGKENVCAILVRGLVELPGTEVVAVVFNEGRLCEELRGAGVRVQVVDESRLGLLTMLRRMKDFFRETRPHVLHTHGYKEHILGAFAARKAGAKVLRTLHGMPEPHRFWDSVRSWCYSRAEWFVIRRMTDIVVAVSKDMQGTLEGKLKRAKLVQIYNGIEVDRLPREFDRAGFRQKLGLPEETKLIGAVGRLVPVKGLRYLVEAAAILAPDHPEFRFPILGDGPCRGELEKQAHERGISDRLMFLGHRDDIPSILGCLDVLVMPSLHEGMPMALLECLGTGIPAVVSRVGGMREVVQDKVNGLHVPPRDSRALAIELDRLFREPGLCQKLRSGAAKDIGARFSSQEMVSRYAELYAQLIDSTRRNLASG